MVGQLRTHAYTCTLAGYYHPGTPPAADAGPAPDGAAQAIRHFSFLVSADGQDWVTVPAADVVLNGGITSGSDWLAYSYAIQDVQGILPGACYLQVRWNSGLPSAQIGRVLLTYRAEKG
jgi:hypothetical protein